MPAVGMRNLRKWKVEISIPEKFEDQLLQELPPPSATPRQPNYLVIYVKYSSGWNLVKWNLWFKRTGLSYSKLPLVIVYKC